MCRLDTGLTCFCQTAAGSIAHWVAATLVGFGEAYSQELRELLNPSEDPNPSNPSQEELEAAQALRQQSESAPSHLSYPLTLLLTSLALPSRGNILCSVHPRTLDVPMYYEV
ncbi:uncharacterized protein BT62DRAFT_926329 [Guyanagaster necrorhizus]|uniref:Uncharacterized protein n=1 Tax=Guyanagaster necrorhizus TaxID=856835 RepID=A0A9P7W476_9AGAR|nr:uncharacterized protein BT62DRAFT_926329 [Guyanagaster necrorhizus MCA 3950]KAG7452110.1 hypothetical protein BT62DRAFT_926329 [Guyanagaster necrorhizus MCA 3950]